MDMDRPYLSIEGNLDTSSSIIMWHTASFLLGTFFSDATASSIFMWRRFIPWTEEKEFFFVVVFLQQLLQLLTNEWNLIFSICVSCVYWETVLFKHGQKWYLRFLDNLNVKMLICLEDKKIKRLLWYSKHYQMIWFYTVILEKAVSFLLW